MHRITRPWFEVWGSEQAQNRTLKGLLVLTLLLNVTQSVGLVVLAVTPPVLFAISTDKTQRVTNTPPPLDLIELETKRVLLAYLAARHTWDWSKIEAAFETASKFVDDANRAKFLKTNALQIKHARQKRLSQKFHIESFTVDIKANRARVQGDRILKIDGLQAVTNQTFELEFTSAKRTAANPEGVYVTSERLVEAPSQGGAK